jgi:hypothetical protein
MFYTSRMGSERFEKLAAELAERDAGLEVRLGEVREGAAELRALAHEAVESFRRAALAHGASHLAQIEVGPVEPDEKHVDCIQFRVTRGRWEVVCVAKAQADQGAKVTLVGPFRRGKPERPCSDQPLHGEEVQTAIEELLVQLIQKASQRER